jgi:hypothetical protein
MLQHYLFQPVQVAESTGFVLSVGVRSCVVWFPELGAQVVPTAALRFIADPLVRRIAAGILARLPGCPVQIAFSE